MKQLKPGSRVTVYQDPITKTKPEGVATLIRLLADDAPLQRWAVKFHSDGFRAERCIDTSQ
jgi:hypothetical protein